MAVTTRSASKTETQPSKNYNAGFFGILFRFSLTILLFAFVIGSTLLYHNCQVSEGPWIPRSQGFCNDFGWSVQNLRVRNTLLDNFKLTLDSFNSIVYQQFSRMFNKLAEDFGTRSTELFNRFGEYTMDTAAWLDENFGEFFQNLWELFSNISTNFFDSLSEISMKVFEASRGYGNQCWEMILPYYERVEAMIQNLRH